MEKSKAGWVWIIQAVSGVALVFLLGMHWVAQHYLANGGLRDYAQVVAYLQNTLAFILEIAFLCVVIAHALFGVRAILFDLGLTPAWQRSVNIILSVLGIFTLAYGFQLAWQIIH